MHLTAHEWNYTWCICNVNARRMTMSFSLVLLFVMCWKMGLFYYFNKLLLCVATSFLGTFLVETLAAGLRILCKSNVLYCWTNCFCCKCKIINSWHNSKLVIVDWSCNHVTNSSGVSDFMLSYKWIDDFYNPALCQGSHAVQLTVRFLINFRVLLCSKTTSFF